jgi:hypothetical protein
MTTVRQLRVDRSWFSGGGEQGPSPSRPASPGSVGLPREGGRPGRTRSATAIGVAEPARAGMTSGINETFQQVGVVVGIAALGSFFESRIAAAFHHAAAAGSRDLHVTALSAVPPELDPEPSALADFPDEGASPCPPNR